MLVFVVVGVILPVPVIAPEIAAVPLKGLPQRFLEDLSWTAWEASPTTTSAVEIHVGADVPPWDTDNCPDVPAVVGAKIVLFVFNVVELLIVGNPSTSVAINFSLLVKGTAHADGPPDNKCNS